MTSDYRGTSPLPVHDYSLILIDQAGNIDLTNHVTQFSIEHGEIDKDQPVLWTGEISLTDRISPVDATISESLDNYDNPSRWGRGAYPIQLSITGTLFATLYLADYFYQPQDGTATASLYSKLDFLTKEHASTPDDDSFAAATVSVPISKSATRGVMPWPVYCQYLAQTGQAGLPAPHFPPSAINTAGIPYQLPTGPYGGTGIDGFSIEQSSAGNPAAEMQKVAYPRRYFLWCDQNDVIQFVKYPLTAAEAGNAIAAFIEDELSPFRRERPPNIDPATATTVEGSGSSTESDPDADETGEEIWPKFFLNEGQDYDSDGRPIRGSVVILEEKEVRKPVITGSPKTGYTKRQVEIIRRSRGSVFPDTYPGSDVLFTAETKTIVSNYDREGYPLTETETIKRARGVINNDLHPGDTNLDPVAIQTSGTWSYYADRIPRSHSVSTTGPGYGITGNGEDTGPEFYSSKQTNWERLGFEQYNEVVRGYKAVGDGEFPFDRLIDDSQTSTRPLEGVPNPPMLDIQEPVGVRRYTFTLQSRPIGDQSALEAPEIVELPYVTNAHTARAAALFVATRKEHQRRPMAIGHPWVDGFHNYRPLKRVDIGSGAYLVDSLQLSGNADDGIKLEYRGLRIATLATPVVKNYPALTGDDTTPTPDEFSYTTPAASETFQVTSPPPVGGDPSIAWHQLSGVSSNLAVGVSEDRTVSWQFIPVFQKRWRDLSLSDWNQLGPSS